MARAVKGHCASVRRIAVILNPTASRYATACSTLSRSAAKTFNFEVMKVAVHDAGEIDREIGKNGAEKNIGLMALPDFIPLANRELIIALAMRYGMPNIFPFRIFATTGALMSLGIDTRDLFRRAASRRSRIAWRKATGFTDTRADHVPTGHQPQDRQGTRPHRAARPTKRRRRGDRIATLFAAARESAIGT